jgi:hypothetical protein
MSILRISDIQHEIMKHLYIALFSLISFSGFSQTISVTVNAAQGIKPISPYIYGRNNNVSGPGTPWQKYNDAGLRMYRENGGNNSTKYNWRLKLTSHPDWYNNVYDADWNASALAILNNAPKAQGLYAFQLLGKVASNKNNNFNDYAYNGSAYWSGVTNNWAGGGNPGSGNPNLYLKDWPADSTAAILDHWFKKLSYDSTRLRYWNMDNEPEIWQGTHDDVATSAITAEIFMQKYFAVAKAVRAKFPGIKLVGPVSPNEWQWYNWNNSKVTALNGQEYPWMEYFIKRIAEEQQASGIRLLDVLDVHFYPSTQNNPDLTLQLHRIWYDTQYNYPGANGVKVTGPGSWDDNIIKEFFFSRCNQWLNQYLGSSHKVTLGISEYGTIATNGSEDPNIIACWYASHLGTFANNGVEIFTPWDWYKGQWEVMHLFSKKFGTLATQTTSSLEDVVSGYSSLSSDSDSLMIIVVNKDRVNPRNVDINIQNFVPGVNTVNGYQLANLPATETFVSKTNNALQSKTYTISANHITLAVPKLSVTLIQIPNPQAVVSGIHNPLKGSVNIFPNPAKGKLDIEPEKPGDYTVVIQDMLGKNVGSWSLSGNSQVDISHLVNGTYVLQMFQNDQVITRKIVKDH